MIKLFTKVKCSAYYRKNQDGTCISMETKNGNLIDEKHIHSPEIKAIAYMRNPEIKCDNKGRIINIDDLEHIKDWYIPIADLSEFCGETVEKTYYDRIEDEFEGVIVGYKNLVVTGYLGTDWYEDDERSYGYCFKKPKDVVKVARVYFKNNCSRLVPLDAMTDASVHEVADSNWYDNKTNI